MLVFRPFFALSQVKAPTNFCSGWKETRVRKATAPIFVETFDSKVLNLCPSNKMHETKMQRISIVTGSNCGIGRITLHL